MFVDLDDALVSDGLLAVARAIFAPPFDWMADADCVGYADLFFAPDGERPGARQHREATARSICLGCPAILPCRSYARQHEEHGFWGGESEKERAAALEFLALGRAS